MTTRMEFGLSPDLERESSGLVPGRYSGTKQSIPNKAKIRQTSQLAV